MSTTASVSRTIAAPAEQIWRLVTDLPRMGEWSNENIGGRWISAPSSAAPGARFRGANRNGIRRWNTTVTVMEAIPGEIFRFKVASTVIPISQWTYEFDETDAGCRVTESWIDRRPGWFKPVARVVSGVSDRGEHTRAGMELTLERLAAAVERRPGGSD